MACDQLAVKMNMMAELLLQCLGFHHENFQLRFYYLSSYSHFLQIHSFNSIVIALKCHSKTLARTLVLILSSRMLKDFIAHMK